MSRAVPLLLLLITLALVLGARIAGPSDLHDKSQPKTVAYTADMALHGHFILPRDMVGGPARKPPMYNWIGVPFVMLFGFAEPVLKMPAILSGLATLALTVYATRRMLQAPELGLDEDTVRATGWLAGIVWLACYPTFSLIYVARPDMPLVAFLTAAWVLATILLTRMDAESSGETPKPREGEGRPDWQVALAFWLCVAGAALSKGPPALLPILYVLVAVKPISGRWRTLRRLHFEWGVPLFVALFGFWVFGAWRSNPQHFWDVLVGEEVTGRFSDGEPLDPYRVPKPFWLIFTWFILKFAPWSIPSGLVLLVVPPRRWFNHPVTPAMAWLAVVLVFFAIPEGKRQDYLAPAYPAASALAAYVTVVLLRRYGMGKAVPWAGFAGVALVIAYTDYQWRRSPEALSRSGENVKAFAREVRRHVPADARILFSELGFHQLQTLMGIHETDSPPPPDALEQPGWLIAPLTELPGARPVAVSDDIPQIVQMKDAVAQIHERRSGRLALYRLPLRVAAQSSATHSASRP